ncbi:restriction endonuclease [Cupriavidus agavae]|uniref:Restriction system protein n=1 Tax=Cupriavidus agavae TaxID=1001822 RepID=A0A4Q7RZW5_9BURK|nr:restriction endonuclease [Cupriavidus agavae]RZT39393.1 restriction system protein [Cupriavidus agavae]
MDAAAAMMEAGKALQSSQQQTIETDKTNRLRQLRHFEQPEVARDDFSIELLRALSWNRFEQLCGAYFAAHGFRADQRSHGADGGIDIRLYFKDLPTPVKLIQCKGWRKKRVDVEPIRALAGVMTRENVREGVFVTMSDFTRPAREEASQARIMAIDGADMVARLRALAPDRKAPLLALAVEGEYWRPACSRCGAQMRPVTNVDRPFWGCSNFARKSCRSRIEVGG